MTDDGIMESEYHMYSYLFNQSNSEQPFEMETRRCMLVNIKDVSVRLQSA